MKRQIKLLLFLMFFLSSNLNVNAHPGNTDSNGGHSCYTNCTKWGYSFGEYHYHSSGRTSTSGFGFSQSYNDNNNEAFWIYLVIGIVISLIIYNYFKGNENNASNSIQPTTIKKIEDKSKKSAFEKYVHITSENVSLYFINKDMRDISKYLKSLDKAYSDQSWFMSIKGPITFIRLNGTTYENRQENIRKLYEGQPVVLYRKHDYGTIECYVNLNSIGVIPSTRSNEIRTIFLKNMIKECYVESIRGGDGKFYGVIIAIVLEDNILVVNHEQDYF